MSPEANYSSKSEDEALPPKQSSSEKKRDKSDLTTLEEVLLHGNNIKNKEDQAGNTNKAYGDDKSQKLLGEIRQRYDEWKSENLSLIGPYAEPEDDDFEVVNRRVKLFNDYKDFLDQKRYAEHFDSRSRLHSTALEEFFVYLFGDLVAEYSESAFLGQADAFKDIFFTPENYRDMVDRPNARVEKKEQDFTIGINVTASMHTADNSDAAEKHVFSVPAVVIECKTYVDKTMLEAMSMSADGMLKVNPNSIYVVAAEWIKLTSEFNPKKFKLDQVYILRKQKNTDRKDRLKDDYEKNPIYEDVVWKMFERVREHITSDWESGTKYALSTGTLIPE